MTQGMAGLTKMDRHGQHVREERMRSYDWFGPSLKKTNLNQYEYLQKNLIKRPPLQTPLQLTTGHQQPNQDEPIYHHHHHQRCNVPQRKRYMDLPPTCWLWDVGQVTFYPFYDLRETWLLSRLLPLAQRRWPICDLLCTCFFRTNELHADALHALSQISGLLGVYQDVPSEDVWQYCSHLN